MRRLIPLALLAAAILVAVMAGPAPFAKLALSAGVPGVAARLADDPVTRGVALFEAGDYRAADYAFREAGRAATYNRAMSLAALGLYADSVAYFDAVLFLDATDADARYNRDLVARLVDPVIGESNTIDGIAATADAPGAEAAVPEQAAPSTLTLAEQRSVVRPRTGQAVAASEAWLTTLADDPALYLKLRLQAEYRRRLDLGLAGPPEDTAW
jgi:Ca-activated chloride channel family protein